MKITLKPAGPSFKPPSNPLMAHVPSPVHPRMPAAIRLKKEKLPNPVANPANPMAVERKLQNSFRYKGSNE